MNDRATARLVGVLFIAADVAGVPAGLLHRPIVDAGGDLATVAANGPAIATAALLTLLMGLAVVGIAVAIHPVLRRFGERLALGYVAIRVLEATVDLVSMLGWLTLLAVGREAVQGGAPDASLSAVGGSLLAMVDVVACAIKPFVFPVDALLLNAVLFRTGLVPRWLSACGLIGAVAFMAFGLIYIYGTDPSPVLAVPIGLQEIALAAWLIVKGFSPVPAVVEDRDELVGSAGMTAARTRAA
jgi:hypothetical protein